MERGDELTAGGDSEDDGEGCLELPGESESRLGDKFNGFVMVSEGDADGRVGDGGDSALDVTVADMEGV